MVLPQAMAWVQYWFCILSLKFCGKFKKICGDISPQSPAFCMYALDFGVLPLHTMYILLNISINCLCTTSPNKGLDSQMRRESALHQWPPFSNCSHSKQTATTKKSHFIYLFKIDTQTDHPSVPASVAIILNTHNKKPRCIWFKKIDKQTDQLSMTAVAIILNRNRHKWRVPWHAKWQN